MAQETGGLKIDNETSDFVLDAEDDAALAVNSDADAADEATEETAEIREQIEVTRVSMGDTIDTIQERLTFSNISDQVSDQVTHAIETAKDTVYDATLGKAVNFMKQTGNDIARSPIGRSISTNPWPYAVIGIGSAWLIYSNMSGGKRKLRGNGSGHKYLTPNERQEREQSDTSTVSNATEGVSSAASGAYDAVAGSAAGAYNSVSTAAADTYGRVSDAATRTYEKVGEIGRSVHEKYDHYVDEKPLAVAAAAAAVGVAVGLAIPSTRYESQLMGETRDSLMNTAGEAAGDLVDKAKQVAGEAGKTIKDEVNTAMGSTASSGGSRPDESSRPKYIDGRSN